ncbi:MAG: polysaccharide biosynthesis/export family protein [Candidatus Omnitrophota bacterium]
MVLKDRLSITEVAKSVGVTPRTIMRWEKAGKIKRSKRDWRGWRFYEKGDIDMIRKFFESSYEYNELEKPASAYAKDVLVSALCAFSLASYIIGGTCFAETAPAQTRAVVETSSSVDINLRDLPAVNTPPPVSMTEAVKYTLGADDVIEIEVRRHPEFSGQYTVTSEGKIEYKFIGDVLVNGLTKVQLQERLSSILSEYIIEPEVNVRILAYLSKVFFVVGEVGNPGKFYMRGNTVKIREALIAAGLPTNAAAMRRCRLITPDNKGRNNFTEVNVFELLYSGDLKCNLEMKPGDVLYIPATIMAKIIRIISPVTNAVSEAGGAAAAGAGIAAVGL